MRSPLGGLSVGRSGQGAEAVPSLRGDERVLACGSSCACSERPGLDHEPVAPSGGGSVGCDIPPRAPGPVSGWVARTIIRRDARLSGVPSRPNPSTRRNPSPSSQSLSSTKVNMRVSKLTVRTRPSLTIVRRLCPRPVSGSHVAWSTIRSSPRLTIEEGRALSYREGPRYNSRSTCRLGRRLRCMQ